jgi:hypothetical protein
MIYRDFSGDRDATVKTDSSRQGQAQQQRSPSLDVAGPVKTGIFTWKDLYRSNTRLSG